MRQKCAVSGIEFEIDSRDLAFYEQVGPVIGGRKHALRPPTLCPDERQRRRLAFRNERFLYKRRSAVSGREIVSAYSPDLPLKVLPKDEWCEVDNMQFGRSFDFNRPFFDQFFDLYRETYKCALVQDGTMINSEYNQFSGWLKNCYLWLDSGKSEDCMYGVLSGYCRSCCDCLYCQRCELCYQSVNLENCYEVFFSSYCINCSSSAYLVDCIGCSNCLCSGNLRNKQYYAFNQPVGKEEFNRVWRAYFNGSYQRQLELQARFEELKRSIPRKALRHTHCENVTGDDLKDCSQVYDSYHCTDCRDCRYCYDLLLKTNDCYDIATFGEQMQYCCELSGCGGALGKSEVSNCFFSVYIFYGGFNILYSISCHESSRELFGCCDVRRKEHCILNKQYSPTEYAAMTASIIEHMGKTGEWGEFFPIHYSPFGYNQSLAQEFYPLERQAAEQLGASWSDYEAPLPAASGVCAAQALPDLLGEAPADICRMAIKCLGTGKLFRVLEPELEFYRKLQLPLPRLHPEERHRVRRRELNPRVIWKRRCARTGEPIETTYPPDSPYIVCNEKAYLAEVD